MKIIGLTGGIGSGKSTIASCFSLLNIPVFNADFEAKKLLESDAELKRKILLLLGSEAYHGSFPNRPFIASKLFSNPDLLSKMNSLVHPAVKNEFTCWIQKQRGNYVIREAAILFESGTYLDCDFIITVLAPESLRVKRVMKRDKVPVTEVKNRIANQWPDERKVELSQAVIVNDDAHLLFPQILSLDFQIRSLT